MIKRLLQNVLAFTLTFIVAFIAYRFFLDSQDRNLPYSLSGIYIFHALASLLICSSLYKLNATKKYKEQLGFIYLASVVVKAILFLIVFRELLFDERSLTNLEAISLLSPLFLGLFFEVFFISKLLKKTTKIKNE